MEFRADVSPIKPGNVTQTQHLIKEGTIPAPDKTDCQRIRINNLSSNTPSVSSSHIAAKIEKYKNSEISSNKADLSKSTPIRFTGPRPKISPDQDILSLVKDLGETRNFNISDTGRVKMTTGSGNAFMDNKGKLFTANSNAHLLDLESLRYEFDDSVPMAEQEQFVKDLQNATVYILSDSQFARLQEFIINRALNEATADTQKDVQKPTLDGKTPIPTAEKIIELPAVATHLEKAAEKPDKKMEMLSPRVQHDETKDKKAKDMKNEQEKFEESKERIRSADSKNITVNEEHIEIGEKKAEQIDKDVDKKNKPKN